MSNTLISKLSKDIKILHWWNLDASKIFTQDVELNLKTSQKTKSLINKWRDEKEKELNSKNHFFFNWPLVHFINQERFGKNLLLTINTKSIFYKDIVWLRNNDFSEYKVMRVLPNALSVFGIIMTKDNKIIMWKRDKIWDWSDSYEFCGWFVRIDEIQDIKQSIHKRFHDDFNMTPNEISELDLLSVYSYPKICETTILFVIYSKYDFATFQKKKNKYTDIQWIDFEKNEIKKFFEKNQNIHWPSQIVMSILYNNYF